MKTTNEKQMTQIFKALSNPQRLALFLKIRSLKDNYKEEGHTCFLANICQGLKIGAPTISHHLKELTNSGLVETEREGKFVICRSNEKLLKEVFEDIFDWKIEDKK